MRFFFLAALTLFVADATSQSLLDESNYWTHRICYFEQYNGVVCNPDAYVINGDTLIEDMTYSKLYLKPSPQSSDYSYWVAALREDEEGKVYFRNSWTNGEIFLYDFSLMEGDTMIVSGFDIFDPDQALELLVTDVDSIQTLDGLWRKRMFLEHTDCGFYEEWVEGIGSVSRELNYVEWVCLADIERLFTCFRQYDEDLQDYVSIYEDNIVEEDYTCLGIPDYINQFEERFVSVFPNPVGDVLSIVGVDDASRLDFTIIHLNGQVILNGCTSPGSRIIDVRSVPSGAYILQMAGNQYISKTRFIKL